MRTWENYKNHVKASNEEDRRNMEEIEEISDIVSSIIRRRQKLGISQCALAERCGIPLSSVARIETFKTMPKLDTLIKAYMRTRPETPSCSSRIDEGGVQMSRELEQWLLEEREEGEDRVATLFKRMKADGRLQEFSDALDDKTAREKLYKEYGIE